jgi:hypothetical protein
VALAIGVQTNLKNELDFTQAHFGPENAISYKLLTARLFVSTNK